MPASSKVHIDDVRIKEIKELTPPAHVLREFPATPKAAETAFEARGAIHRILFGADDRLLVVIGPCSIHDYDAAMEYARRLKGEADRLKNDLLVVMRVYFEKPRTTVGWKGLINDPHLDGTFAINEGLRLARKLLWDVNELGVPAGTEFLDMITPQYIADLISWGAIGARTTEVMGASFRNTGQILALAGCDLLTISPELLAALQASSEPVTRALDAALARAAEMPELHFDEAPFRWALNQDAMATEKLAEGIRAFAADAVKLDRLIQEQQA